MRLTESQVGNLTNLLDVMFTEESASLVFAGKFGTDTLEELWILRNSLYDHDREREEISDMEAWNPVDSVDDDEDFSCYNPDEGVMD